jgi:hypothetical protein
MTGFTKLEQAVFDHICAVEIGRSELLRALLNTAQVSERKNTGVGFYTSFEVDGSHLVLEDSERGMIHGPQLFRAKLREEVVLCMGFILWLKNGHPDCLEGYQYYAEINGRSETISVLQDDLEALEPIGLTPAA